jgi:hypothetical protein
MSIRVERAGGPPDLPAAFARFVVQHLGGRSLDDQKDEEAKLGKFPDFACYRDIVLIEMKHLEVEQNERINATYKSRVRADEEPMFYGKRRLDVSAFSNADEIASAILSKLAQTSSIIEELQREAERSAVLSLALNSRQARVTQHPPGAQAADVTSQYEEGLQKASDALNKAAIALKNVDASRG